jgi:hypothetical protein
MDHNTAANILDTEHDTFKKYLRSMKQSGDLDSVAFTLL